MDTRVTSTKGKIFPKRFFPNSKISLPILDEIKNQAFGGTGRNPLN
jgi:hypothetical protein